MITIAWWWLVVWPVTASVSVWLCTRQQWRRWRRQQRRHEVRIRLVDADGTAWMDVTCDQLEMIRRYGGQDDPPWQTLEVIGPRAYGYRLQVAPAYPDAQ